jgi:ornithine decarboxylase
MPPSGATCPRCRCYYAVKANPEPAIVRTLYRAGASFDVASLPEFLLVYENIRRLPPKERQDFIWDKIVYANPIKPKETLQALDRYKPLVTYDNPAELRKIRRYAPTPAWRCACACPTPARWWNCRRSSAATPARRWT